MKVTPSRPTAADASFAALIGLFITLIGNCVVNNVDSVNEELRTDIFGDSSDAGDWWDDADIDTAEYGVCIETGVYECAADE